VCVFVSEKEERGGGGGGGEGGRERGRKIDRARERLRLCVICEFLNIFYLLVFLRE
jgi:hypothetical protein